MKEISRFVIVIFSQVPKIMPPKLAFMLVKVEFSRLIDSPND
jgi:hypothetical protein